MCESSNSYLFFGYALNFLCVVLGYLDYNLAVVGKRNAICILFITTTCAICLH